MINLSKFAENLSDLIFDKKITQKQLAEAVGLEEASICRYLKGNCEPTVKAVVALADFFNCSVDFLLGLTEEKASTSYLPCPPVSERIKNYLEKSGLTGHALCQKANLIDSRFYHWKDGSHEPSIESIEKFTIYFECSFDEFLGRIK